MGEESGKPAVLRDKRSGPLQAGAVLASCLERYGTAVMFSVLAVSCVHLLWRNTIKPFWFDELFTRNLAQQTSWVSYRAGLAADGNPPLYSMAAWIMGHIAGYGTLSMRAPALVAFLAASVLLYGIVRSRLGVLPALLALVLFETNPAVTVFAIEARPYAFVLFFTTLGFAGWQAATSRRISPPWARWLIGFSIAGSILSHHYGVLSVGLPLSCGELARTLRRRKVDWSVVAAVGSGLPALLVTLPLARATRDTLLQYTNYPRGLPHSLEGSDYEALLAMPERTMLIVVLVIAIVLWGRRGGIRKMDQSMALPRWPVHEAVALVGSVSTLFVVFVLCHVTTGYFNGLRYGIGSFFGVVALAATLYVCLDRQAQCVMFLVLALPFVAALPRGVPHGRAEPPEMACIRSLPNVPIVVARGLAYPQYWQYADSVTRARLLFLTDPTYARRETANVPELAMAAQKKIFPMSVTPYRDFVQSNPVFLIVVSGVAGQDYAATHLQQDGYALVPFAAPAACAAGTVQKASRRQ